MRCGAPYLVVAFAAIALGIAFELLRLATGIGGSAWNSLANNWVYMAIEFVAIGGLRRPGGLAARASRRVAVDDGRAGRVERR